MIPYSTSGKRYQYGRITRKCMWHSIDNKPTKEGIIVVAHFIGDRMDWFSTDWANIEGYFGPNSANYCGERNPTHWMYHSEYREILEKIGRQQGCTPVV